MVIVGLEIWEKIGQGLVNLLLHYESVFVRLETPRGSPHLDQDSLKQILGWKQSWKPFFLKIPREGDLTDFTDFVVYSPIRCRCGVVIGLDQRNQKAGLPTILRSRKPKLSTQKTKIKEVGPLGRIIENRKAECY